MPHAISGKGARVFGHACITGWFALAKQGTRMYVHGQSCTELPHAYAVSPGFLWGEGQGEAFRFLELGAPLHRASIRRAWN